MIGKYITGKSFRGCLNYCLHDKLQNQDGQAAVKNRAEVLVYHKCYGNDKELIQQFEDVRLLNQKVSKPVLHITLSLAPGERLGRDKLAEIIEECAKDFGFAANQYVAVGHRDTDHQHLHIVANRIGLDGRTVSDSNSYKKMASFCRRMEVKFSLAQVLSPKPFLPREQRQLPRLDQRKERLKESIQASLAASKSFDQFEERMKAEGYQVLKGCGISFTDTKGVKVKGSEVGFSLFRIHRLLEQINLRQQPIKPAVPASALGRETTDNKLHKSNQQSLQKPKEKQEPATENQLSTALHLLLKHEKEPPAITPKWLKKKYQRQNNRPH